ncbi:MAG TPA: hypothetical protein DEQ06_08265 [Porphyromonadaceae bacterium]|nr:hypothetical protein [Porphyromonadaceae bacterium]
MNMRAFGTQIIGSNFTVTPDHLTKTLTMKKIKNYFFLRKYKLLVGYSQLYIRIITVFNFPFGDGSQ